MNEQRNEIIFRLCLAIDDMNKNEKISISDENIERLSLTCEVKRETKIDKIFRFDDSIENIDDR